MKILLIKLKNKYKITFPTQYDVGVDNVTQMN